ncbi:MAG: imidazole glycerol phosphate synthase subunit HisH [Anaerolineales bacterium]|nr:imidazole glycerol phosphate synthase subunit HisH [Anaerolineales bacterium]
MIAIINYGAGNLHSVHKAVEYVGGEAVVTSDAQTILSAEKVILPGVGAFQDGMEGLDARGLLPVVKQIAESGRPLLGICLGMQLFFDVSEEQGAHQGLGLLPGQVLAFTKPGMKIPQIGWNQLEITSNFPLLKNIPNEAYVYFNHSYYCQPKNQAHVIATTDYGSQFASVVLSKNIYGVQFHPEKSQKVGLQILKNFVELENE